MNLFHCQLAARNCIGLLIHNGFPNSPSLREWCTTPSLTKNEHILKTGRKYMSLGISYSYNIERSIMLLNMGHSSNTSCIVSFCNKNSCTKSKLGKSTRNWFTSYEINLDGVVNACFRIWVSDGASIVRYNGRDTFRSKENFCDAAQLPSSLFSRDALEDKTPFGIEK